LRGEQHKRRASGRFGGQNVSWQNVSWQNVSWQNVSWQNVSRMARRAGLARMPEPEPELNLLARVRSLRRAP